MSEKPVFVLAFANDPERGGRYLEHLPAEKRAIEAALEPPRRAGQIDVVTKTDVTLGEIRGVLAEVGDRLAVFHFAGHAGAAEVLLLTEAGTVEAAGAAGLAAMVGGGRKPVLVFLNGCASAGQVQALHEAGVPAVIATHEAIDDAVAWAFAGAFYRSLAEGATVRGAFELAAGTLTSRHGHEPRAFYSRSFVPEEDAPAIEWPWSIFVHEAHAEWVERWRLSTPEDGRDRGPLRRILSIGADDVVLRGGDTEVRSKHRGITAAEEDRLWQLERRRHQRLPDASHTTRDAGDTAASALHGALLQVGALLGERFLVGAVAEALRQAIGAAQQRGASLRLGIEVTDERIERLPWETLRLVEGEGLYSQPLALTQGVQLFRHVDLDPVPAMGIPGPLRILVVIGSPEEQNARGELLDMERELERILDAVEDARGAHAFVHVLPVGSVGAIADELRRQRYHVLHISCHAGPGKLILEKEDGSRDEVTAEQLAKKALVSDRGVPLVFLAGCATGLRAEGESGDAESSGSEHLPGLAHALLAHGVPAVLATQAPVGDRYATQLGACLYRALSRHDPPDPLAAVAWARQEVERLRAATDDRREKEALAEWATPALYLRGISRPLFDPKGEKEKVEAPPPPTLADGIVVRSVGAFVGRRRELRLSRQALLAGKPPGLVLHGLGGVGKSSLAAELVNRLGDTGFFVLSVMGRTSVESLLGDVLKCVRFRANLERSAALGAVAQHLADPKIDWPERLDLVCQQVLATRRLLLLLDNFEDNLDADHQIDVPDLDAFIARWLRHAGQSRVLVTCRFPVQLPKEAKGLLAHRALGPLSFAETRKLMWRLPALDALAPDQRMRAYHDVGGHPRALEYLDALLRGGAAVFDDVGDRLEKAVRDRGIDDPADWLGKTAGDFDASLAETVTLAAHDVLLDGLLERLDPEPLARDLLAAAAVYRQPVAEPALRWHFSEAEPLPKAPVMDRIRAAQAEAKKAGKQLTIEEMGLAPADQLALMHEMASCKEPAVPVPEAFAPAFSLLLGLGLVAPVQRTDKEALRFTVHRWTAGELLSLRRIEEADRRRLHARAATY